MKGRSKELILEESRIYSTKYWVQSWEAQRTDWEKSPNFDLFAVAECVGEPQITNPYQKCTIKLNDYIFKDL